MENKSVQRSVGPNKVHEKPKHFKKSIIKLLRIQQKIKTILYNGNNIWSYELNLCNNWTK